MTDKISKHLFCHKKQVEEENFSSLKKITSDKMSVRTSQQGIFRPLTKSSPCLTGCFRLTLHLAVACDVYDGVFLRCTFSYKMSRMRS